MSLINIPTAGSWLCRAQLLSLALKGHDWLRGRRLSRHCVNIHPALQLGTVESIGQLLGYCTKQILQTDNIFTFNVKCEFKSVGHKAFSKLQHTVHN